MNFLGHSYFKGSSPLFLVGNVCGDFYKGLPKKLDLPAEMIEGVKFHRRLDIVTDSTSAVAKAKLQLSKYGRYSGIILDIFYDHFLAVNWKKLHDLPLEIYSKEVYIAITDSYQYIPLKSRKAVDHMIGEDWFISYRDLDFLYKTLKRVSNRISKENNIEDSIYDLKNNYDFFQKNFFEFWNELNKSIIKV